MSAIEGQWWAGITCEKTLQTSTMTYANQIEYKSTWNVINVSFDLSSPEPATYPHVCPYCGSTFDVTLTPRKDVDLTREEVEMKFSANMRKRLLQLLLSIVISALFIPAYLLGGATLGVLMVFVSMVGMGMLFYFTVIVFRSIRAKRRYRRDGTIPLYFQMVSPYKVTIVDPTNTHIWKQQRKGKITKSGSMEYGILPTPGNIDEFIPYDYIRSRL